MLTYTEYRILKSMRGFSLYEHPIYEVLTEKHYGLSNKNLAFWENYLCKKLRIKEYVVEVSLDNLKLYNFISSFYDELTPQGLAALDFYPKEAQKVWLTQYFPIIISLLALAVSVIALIF